VCAGRWRREGRMRCRTQVLSGEAAGRVWALGLGQNN
jgi:hypothetical protein